ncbi:hypothetical protein CC78DRAFT_599262 [Lojkania enalia]|uniref:Uncharacterized protein n=1 Tax=Lojkania enalia TaxID=147567 RepID=A0A9P4MUD7_9PLEO|nr:hypothetical protein CC78DRAFT_599262 [Didymosphaeria enalia]
MPSQLMKLVNKASSLNEPLFPELTTPPTMNPLASKGDLNFLDQGDFDFTHNLLGQDEGRGTPQRSTIRSDPEGGIDGLEEEDEEVEEAEDVEEEEEEEDDDEDEDEDQDHDEEDDDDDDDDYDDDYANRRNASVRGVALKKKTVGSKQMNSRAQGRKSPKRRRTGKATYTVTTPSPVEPQLEPNGNSLGFGGRMQQKSQPIQSHQYANNTTQMFNTSPPNVGQMFSSTHATQRTLGNQHYNAPVQSEMFGSIPQNGIFHSPPSNSMFPGSSPNGLFPSQSQSGMFNSTSQSPMLNSASQNGMFNGAPQNGIYNGAIPNEGFNCNTQDGMFDTSQSALSHNQSSINTRLSSLRKQQTQPAISNVSQPKNSKNVAGRKKNDGGATSLTLRSKKSVRRTRKE